MKKLCTAKSAQNMVSKTLAFNPLNPKGFCIFEQFSAYTRPMGFRDSIFKVTMESAAVLRH